MSARTHTRRAAVKVAAILLAASMVVATYGAPMVFAHVLGAPALRLSVFLDDGNREPSTNFFLSVTVWRLSVRLEWTDGRRPPAQPSPF